MLQKRTDLIENLTQRQASALPYLLRPGTITVQARNAGQTPMSRQIVIRVCPWLATEDDEFYGRVPSRSQGDVRMGVPKSFPLDGGMLGWWILTYPSAR